MSAITNSSPAHRSSYFPTLFSLSFSNILPVCICQQINVEYKYQELVDSLVRAPCQCPDGGVRATRSFHSHLLLARLVADTNGTDRQTQRQVLSIACPSTCIYTTGLVLLDSFLLRYPERKIADGTAHQVV